MGTQEDKISSNRRRLFKALSAAPVVATLSPGEALANHSAFQCVSNIRNPVHEPNLDHRYLGPVVQHGFAYAALHYWLIGDGWSYKNRWRSDPFRHDPYPDVMIVEYIDPVTNQRSYYDTLNPGNPTPIKFERNWSNHRLTLKTKDSNNNWRKRRVVPRHAGKGHFAVFGYGVSGDTQFKVEGPYPKVTPNQHANYQGITTTCLNSVPLKTASASGGRWTLTIG